MSFVLFRVFVPTLFIFITVIHSARAGGTASPSAKEIGECLIGELTGDYSELTKHRFYEKLRAKIPGFDPKKVSFKNADAHPGGALAQPFNDDDFLRKSVTTVLSYHSHEAALANFNINHGTLSFDIEVSPAFSGSGAYSYFLSKIVTIHPEIKEIATRMPYQESENAKNFFHALFGSSSSFVTSARDLAVNLNQNVASGNIEKNVQLRQKILSALKNNKATSARTSAGFGKITKVIIDPKTFVLSYVVERGAFDDSQVQVVIRDDIDSPTEGSVVQLSSDGSIQALKASALSLPLYDQMRPQAGDRRVNP